MRLLSLTLSLCLLAFAVFSQTGVQETKIDHSTEPRYTDTATISTAHLKELRSQFGKNKKYDKEYEKLVLPALSFFPQLKDYRVTFKVRNHGVPLSSRPTYGSMFRQARKRTYMVFISTDTTTQWKVIQINRVPQMAQIGIIGHELSHIIQFKEKTGFGLLGLGISHVSRSYMNKFEFQADSIGIAQGMGDYFLVWAIHAREAFGATDPQQLEVKGEMYNYKERYMSPATIRRYMEEMEKSK